MNEFKPFGLDGTVGADFLPPDKYATDEERLKGFQPGVARRELFNSVFRQTSTVAAAVAEFVSQELGEDVKDDGIFTNFATQLKRAAAKKVEAEHEYNVQKNTDLETKISFQKTEMENKLNTQLEALKTDFRNELSNMIDNLKNNFVYELCEFYFFRRKKLPNGFLPATGGIIENADEKYPQAWNWLLENGEENGLLLSEKEWELASIRPFLEECKEHFYAQEIAKKTTEKTFNDFLIFHWQELEKNNTAEVRQVLEIKKEEINKCLLELFWRGVPKDDYELDILIFMYKNLELGYDYNRDITAGGSRNIKPFNHYPPKKMPGWHGVGGVPFFSQNLEAKTLRLPDIRGMYAENFGGLNNLAVGGVHGDTVRRMISHFGGNLKDQTIGFYDINSPAIQQGILKSEIVDTTGYSSIRCGSNWYNYTRAFTIDTGKGLPTGEVTAPAAFGVCPAVFLGNK